MNRLGSVKDMDWINSMEPHLNRSQYRTTIYAQHLSEKSKSTKVALQVNIKLHLESRSNALIIIQGKDNKVRDMFLHVKMGRQPD